MKKIYVVLFCLTKLMSISAQYNQNNDSKMKLQVSYRKLPPSFQKPELMRQRLDRDFSAREQHKRILKNVCVEKTRRYTQKLSSYWHSIINRSPFFYKRSTRRYDLFRFPQMIKKCFRGEPAIKSLIGRFAPFLFCFMPLMSVSSHMKSCSCPMKSSSCPTLTEQQKRIAEDTDDTEIDFERDNGVDPEIKIKIKKIKQETIKEYREEQEREKKQEKESKYRLEMINTHISVPKYAQGDDTRATKCWNGYVSECKKIKEELQVYYKKAVERETEHARLITKMKQCSLALEPHVELEQPHDQTKAYFNRLENDVIKKLNKKIIDIYMKEYGEKVECLDISYNRSAAEWYYEEKEMPRGHVYYYPRTYSPHDLIRFCLGDNCSAMPTYVGGKKSRKEDSWQYRRKELKPHAYCDALLRDNEEEKQIMRFGQALDDWITFLEKKARE